MFHYILRTLHSSSLLIFISSVGVFTNRFTSLVGAFTNQYPNQERPLTNARRYLHNQAQPEALQRSFSSRPL